ncbi:O-antigen ligase family protein [Stenotrophomonas sp. NLF4-10]|uniref:O-antigen ligase family protein n=1 Tax=Stenotrophomonas sp. NLF4-10 TaxID=2918754 RepID=UPI001EFAB71D|nr:O-antigen ligase family protein [Stenotrophomonas sp. NLF4-10]MCG8275778.1 O-antigen ligase family protein [Stenotrophomonas sp. NLF4-10]
MANLPADSTSRISAPLAGRWAPAWVLAFVALWPLPGIAEAVLVLAALFAVVRLLQPRMRGAVGATLGVPVWALTSVLFLAYWLPQLLSALDAQEPGRALGKVAGGLRYLPFMWLVAMAVADDARRRVTFAGLAVIAGIWSLDALLQALFAASPLFWSLDQLKQLLSGHALCLPQDMIGSGRVNGVFGACNPKLGQVLASLSPFLLLLAGRCWGRIGWAVAAMFAGVAILLAGSRASWITYALVLLFTGWRLLGARWMALAVLAAVLGVAALGTGSTQVRERIAATLPALSGKAADINTALAGRGRIWSGALCMVREHPVNGVGVRGFRNAWPECDPTHGQGTEWGDGPALHAHQLVLEILSETGLLGLLLWLMGAAMAWRAWRYADAAARDRARPAALALLVTVFPFNTHLAFHSAFWGSVLLLLAALYAGALTARNE